MKNASVASVFKELENQLNFNFSYEAQLIDEAETLNINERNTPLKRVLKKTIGK